MESSIDLDGQRKSLGQAGDDDLGPFVIINIAADNANIDGATTPTNTHAVGDTNAQNTHNNHDHR